MTGDVDTENPKHPVKSPGVCKAKGQSHYRKSFLSIEASKKPQAIKFKSMIYSRSKTQETAGNEFNKKIGRSSTRKSAECACAERKQLNETEMQTSCVDGRCGVAQPSARLQAAYGSMLPSWEPPQQAGRRHEGLSSKVY